MILVFVLDGVRPDVLNPLDSPTLFRLRQEGVNYLNSHAAFPTVTRVNAATIATGAYPGRHGLVSNAMSVAQVSRTGRVDTAQFRQLLALAEVSNGCVLLTRTLGERLHAHGRRFAAVSSGSPGTSLLLNPCALHGVGILVNGYLEPGVLVAFPPDVNTAILQRFGAAPPKGERFEPHRAAVDWTQNVLHSFVLPELRPDVVLNWITEPDHMQHAFGVGSPESRAILRHVDQQIAQCLHTLDTLGLAEETDIFVVSDHGFSLATDAINVEQELLRAGLKAATDADDVLVASSDEAMLLHVQEHSPTRIRQLVEFLQAQPWTDVLFTRGRGAHGVPAVPGHARATDDPEGWVEGTFALEYIHIANAVRGPDIVFTFPWTSAKNPFGLAGTDWMETRRETGPLTAPLSNHGSMSPWTMRNTLFAWGPHFKRGVEVRVPAGNVDLVPTILALTGIQDHADLDGRILHEALRDGPDEEQVAVETRVHTTTACHGQYRAALQASQVGPYRYIDKSWRERS
jgi:predicted AlkP superfamily pyrophosphatase or phosphodiesterase